MSLPKISVVIPTVEGREPVLERCVAAYERCAPGSYELELVIMHDLPSCGAGWQAGLDQGTTGDYIHLTCDDIEPIPGWAEPAIETVLKGYVPAPVVRDFHGTPQSLPVVGQVGPDWAPVHMTSLPFCSARQMERIVPLMTAHYWTDDFFSFRAIRGGWQPRCRVNYAFLHGWAQHKRGAGFTEHERMVLDERYFRTAIDMVLAGQWNAPWPPNGGRPQ